MREKKRDLPEVALVWAVWTKVAHPAFSCANFRGRRAICWLDPLTVKKKPRYFRSAYGLNTLSTGIYIYWNKGIGKREDIDHMNEV